MIEKVEEPIGAGMDVDAGFRLLMHKRETGFSLELELAEKAIDHATKANPDFVPPNKPTMLADYDAQEEVLTTYPVTVNFGKYFLEPKYSKIEKIVLEGVDDLSEGHRSTDSIYFEELPIGVIRNPLAGFGLNYDMRFMIRAIEKIGGIDTLVLTTERNAGLIGTALHLPYGIFNMMRKAINRAHSSAVAVANRAKLDYVDTTVRLLIDPDYAPIPGDGSEQHLEEILTDKLLGRGRSESKVASTAAIKTVRKTLKAIAAEDPVELMDLHREIELLTLEDLIERIAKKIGQTTLKEAHWQKFFAQNIFVLQLAFNLPTILFQGQVSVGGTKFDGGGTKLADYLLRLGNTGNLAIVEIKTPRTKLVSPTEYRVGLHAPTSDLSGAVSQVLDQRYFLTMEIDQRRGRSKVYDVFTYSVPCFVIAGLLPANEDEQKSFELYRHNLRDVVVITFDELLDKLRTLLAFLKEEPKSEAPAPTDSHDFSDLI